MKNTSSYLYIEGTSFHREDKIVVKIEKIPKIKIILQFCIKQSFEFCRYNQIKFNSLAQITMKKVLEIAKFQQTGSIGICCHLIHEHRFSSLGDTVEHT